MKYGQKVIEPQESTEGLVIWALAKANLLKMLVKGFLKETGTITKIIILTGRVTFLITTQMLVSLSDNIPGRYGIGRVSKTLTSWFDSNPVCQIKENIMKRM